jgi:flagellar protein FliS
MYANSARAAVAYKQTSVQSSSPLELVVLLYDGALRHTLAAKDAIATNDAFRRREAFSKTLAIITELQTTLNIEEGGQVATQLDAMYTYIIGRLLDANVKKDPAPLDEIERLLRPLRDAWAQIAAQPQGA